MQKSETIAVVACSATKDPSTSWKLQKTWANEPTYEELYTDYQSAQDDHGLVLVDLERWEVNLDGGRPVPSPKGKSKVRPKLIRKQAEWKYPALEEPFLNTEKMFEVRPRTYEDTSSADQNALLLNYQWNVKINKTELIGDIVRNDVNEGTVIVKTGWYAEEGTRMVEQEFPVYASPEESLQIIQMGIQSGEIPEEQAQSMLMSGQPIQVGTEMREVEETYLVENKPMYEVCDNKNVILDPTSNGKYEDIQFIIHEYDTDMSTLQKQAYTKEIEVDEETGEEVTVESGIYKNLDKVTVTKSTDNKEYYNDTTTDTTQFEFSDKPRQKLRAYEYWGYWDIEGNGEVEAIVATWVGKTIIRMERSPFPFKGLPFSFATYMPVKNSLYGEPDGELLIDNQETIGKMTRAALDITSTHAVGQEFIDEQFFASPSQRDNYKSGKTAYFRHGMDPKSAVFKQGVDRVDNTVFNMINMNNAEAESYSGTKAFSQGISSQALGSVATGIRNALDATSKRELSLLRRLSALIQDLGNKTIQMNQVFLEEEEVVRVTNSEYVPIRREDIAGEYDLIVAVSTPEKDNDTAEKLNMMMQTNAASMDPALSKMIYAQIAKLWNQPELEQQIKEFEPKPDPAAEAIKELQLENAKLENKKLNMEIASMVKNIESEDSKIRERESRTAQNLKSETAENNAEARFKNAQAAKLEEETDLLAQDFLRKQDGSYRREQIADKEVDMRFKEDMEGYKHLQKQEEREVNRIDKEIDEVRLQKTQKESNGQV